VGSRLHPIEPRMREETCFYRDYQIDVFRFGTGWQALIYAPGAPLPLNEQPTNRWANGKDQGLPASAEPKNVNLVVAIKTGFLSHSRLDRMKSAAHRKPRILQKAKHPNCRNASLTCSAPSRVGGSST